MDITLLPMFNFSTVVHYVDFFDILHIFRIYLLRPNAVSPNTAADLKSFISSQTLLFGSFHYTLL